MQRSKGLTVVAIVALAMITATIYYLLTRLRSTGSFAQYLWNFRWDFARGAWMTIKISILAMGLAIAFGIVLALCRVYGSGLVSRLSLAYIEIVRGTPLLVQLYFLYYGLPHIPIPQALTATGLASLAPAAAEALRLDALTAAIVGMGLNYAAYEAEIYRAGIMAIPRAQTEAAYSLGLSKWQTIRHIILPQALRLVVPPVTNDFVALFKDTSIVSIVAITELTKTFVNAGISTQKYLGFAIVTALLYFLISYPVSKLARHLERRIHPHHDFDLQPE